MSHVVEIRMPQYQFTCETYSRFIEARLEGAQEPINPRLKQSISYLFAAGMIAILEPKILKPLLAEQDLSLTDDLPSLKNQEPSRHIAHYRLLSTAIRNVTQHEYSSEEIVTHLSHYLDLTTRLQDTTVIPEEQQTDYRTLVNVLKETKRLQNNPTELY